MRLKLYVTTFRPPLEIVDIPVFARNTFKFIHVQPLFQLLIVYFSYICFGC
jgi:hypothetical protein